MNIPELLDNIEPNYTGVLDVARHCDEEKLHIAENNARRYDLVSVICDLGEDIEQVTERCDPIFQGGEIKGVPFGGLNLILSLFSYSRYIENSIYKDTGSGFVRKDHSNSFPVPLEDLKDMASEHRKFAANEIKRLSAYLCSEYHTNCICDTKLCTNSTRPTTTARKYKNITSR